MRLIPAVLFVLFASAASAATGTAPASVVLGAVTVSPESASVADVGVPVVTGGPVSVSSAPASADVGVVAPVSTEPASVAPVSTAPTAAVPSGPAALPSAITTTEQAAASVGILVTALQSGSWPLFFGVFIMLVVFILDRLMGLRDRVGSQALPYVAIGLAVLGTLGYGLASGLTILAALGQGIAAGLSAIGTWEVVKPAKPAVSDPAPVSPPSA